MKNSSLPILLALLLVVSCVRGTDESYEAEIEEIEKSLTTAIQIEGEPVQYTLAERMVYYKVPGLSIAVIKDGKVRWAKGYGKVSNSSGEDVEVTPNTLFQAGSISKPVAALSVLKLVEEGMLDLDTDVNTYLKNWKVPESEFTKMEKVTLRRLLSHTSGLTVHGFPGYRRGVPIPSLIEVLNGEGNTPPVVVDTIPGSIWRYSGGGYTLMEKIVEDVSGLAFEEVMHDKVLQPTGMSKSTYYQPLPMNLEASASAAYNRNGEVVSGFWNNYPEKAAAGLWTTPSDLAKYCIEVQDILAGKKDGVLSQESIQQMLTKNLNNWGIGPLLQWEADSLIFRHGGKNEGFTNEMIAFAYKGGGVIIMTNADNGSPLINEVLQSISTYYAWGINTPRMIDSYPTEAEQLEKLVGIYKYNGEGGPVPNVQGEFLVEVILEGGKLRMIDSYGYLNSVLAQTGEMEFIKLDEGQEIKFLKYDKTNSYAFLYYDFFQFDKVE